MKKWKIFLFLILFAGLTIRLISAVKADYLLPTVLATPVVSPDGRDYDHRALNILCNRGYGYGYTPTHALFRTPVYPLFLAVVYLICGHSFLVVRVVQSIIGTLTCLLIYLIGFNIFGSKKIALLSVGIAALYPLFVFDCIQILTECLFTFLLAAAVFFILHFHDTKRMQFLLAGGLSLGLCALTRPVGIILLPLTCLWFFLVVKGKRQGLIYSLIVVLASLIVVSPWSIHNYIVYGRLILLSSQPSTMLWVGSGEWQGKGKDNFNEQFHKAAPDEFYKKAFGFILRNPKRFLKGRSRQFLRFWRIVPGLNHSLIRNIINLLSITFIPVVGLAGLFLSLSYKREKTLFFMMSTIAFTLAHTLTVGAVRYRVPLVDPYLIIFASFLIARILRFSYRGWRENGASI